MDPELSTPLAGRAPPGGGRLPARARALLGEPHVREARRYLESDDGRVLNQQRELTEIPAPPFGEEARGRRVAELFREAGLEDVRADEVGNVLAWLRPVTRGEGERRGGAEGAGQRVPGPAARRGTGSALSSARDATAAAGPPDGRDPQHPPPLVVSAHLDTVFPADTDVRVRVRGDRLVGPGISDDGRGLAALLGLARVLTAVALPVRPPILFAATVGEEGAGNLRGVRHLFREDGPAHAARGFISLDGAGMGRIVTQGVGSRRFRVVVSGPGGHSWVNWGTANPIHALGDAVARWSAMALPEHPPATLTVARWGGGTSINAIPQEAWVELELRCVSEEILARLEAQVRRVLTEALQKANRGAHPGTETIRAEVECIGTRPAGQTPEDALLVRAAASATRALEGAPELAVSSTDANIPMSLGLPAITMGAGGEAGQAHTTDEWYRNVQGPDGILRALMTVLLVGEAEEEKG